MEIDDTLTTANSSYDCKIVQQPGTGTSYTLQPMFDAWAGTAGIRLFPGTVYLCADSAVRFPTSHIPLAKFEHLHQVDSRRRQSGYSPRLYPAALGDCLLAWVYRWSDDDVGREFVGNLEECSAPRLLEVVAPIGIKRAFGAGTLCVRFIAA